MERRRPGHSCELVKDRGVQVAPGVVRGRAEGVPKESKQGVASTHGRPESSRNEDDGEEGS